MQLNADMIADAVVDTVAIALAPAARDLAQMKGMIDGLTARLAVLEDRSLLVPRDGRDGKDAPLPDLDAIAVKAAALIPEPRDGADGKDADTTLIASLHAEIVSLKALVARPDDIEAKVAAAVALAIKSLPTPKDGMPGRDGKDGRDVDAALLETIVAASVERVLAEWPKPKDGASLTVEDVAPLIKSEVSSAVAALPKAKDGRGIGDLFVERDGELSVTFTDGGRVKVGNIIGPPGKDGINGERGKDGADGLGFDDLQGEFDEAKGWVLRFARGEQVKEFAAPVPRDGGVYRPGTLYLKGQYVTAQGSLWLALTDTRDRPGDGSKSWRLIVKRGRDGRDLRADS